MLFLQLFPALRNETGPLVVYTSMQRIFVVLTSVVFLALFAMGQKSKPVANESIPISTQTLLNGVKNPNSKGVIKSVLLLECPKNSRKGTGFVVMGGNVITTNSHVVGLCDAEDLIGISSVSNEQVKFSSMERDDDRDLALLCPNKPLPYALKLSGSEKPEVETEVETWGYPLRYDGPAPVLSRGYVAGYSTNQHRRDDGGLGNPVERLIVNGALNPGNSGGPLIDRATGRVIGIVVEKWLLYSPNVESVITALEHPGAGLGGGAPIYVTYPNGEVKQVSQTEGTRVALKEIFEMSQVMIGEAISVSELNSFIKEKQQSLKCGTKR